MAVHDLPPGEAELYHFPVDRVKDNRLNGLLREIAEVIQQEDDMRALRHFAQSLKLLAGRARSRAYSSSDDDLKVW